MEKRECMRGQQRAARRGSRQGWGERLSRVSLRHRAGMRPLQQPLDFLERLEKMKHVFTRFSVIHIFYFKDMFSSFLF